MEKGRKKGSTYTLYIRIHAEHVISSTYLNRLPHSIAQLPQSMLPLSWLLNGLVEAFDRNIALTDTATIQSTIG